MNGLTDESGEIQLPGAPLTVGQPEPRFPVSHRAWSRIRERVSALSDPIPWARDLAWSAVTLSGASALALVAWLPVLGQLSRDSQLVFAWITPALVTSVIASAVVATLAFVMHAKMKGGIRREATHIVEDMDDIYAPHQARQGSPEPMVIVPQPSLRPHTETEGKPVRHDVPLRRIGTGAGASSPIVARGPAARSIGTSSEAQRRQQYIEGQRVKHRKFGVGTVVKSTLTHGDEEVIVRFDAVGIKILSASLANLQLA